MDIKNIISYVYDISGIFVLWIAIHYIAANLYPRFCAETSLFGFIKSIFVTQAPHCVAMRWVIYNGGNIINSMWASIALWVTTKIFNGVFVPNRQ